MAHGFLNYCKSCRRAYQKNRPHEAIAEIERRRNQKVHRKAFQARNLKRWRRENPARTAAQRDRRRALKMGADGEYTAEQFLALCRRYRNASLSCGSSDKPLTPDHIVPLTLGGSNRITNIQPLCRRCNSRKNVKVVDYRPDAVPLNAPRKLLT
jgi:5-methylcytosine-specific restriction endonuclease McrA